MRCKTVSFVLVVVTSFVIINGRTENKSIHSDAGLSVLQLIEKYKFPLERHFVTTKDGYILELHRIPHGRQNKENKGPILLMHGLMSSSADYVNFGENSLGFILADSGYDVWLGNARGNFWSRNHTTLNPDNNEFWMFSWHEIGVYDLPASIDYILNSTQQQKLFYIGHSQGGTSFFVMTSLLPEYNDKIRLMSALAPATYMANLKNQLVKLVPFFLDYIMSLKYEIEVLPHCDWCSDVVEIFCTRRELMCVNIFQILFGHNPEQFNPSMLSVITTNAPSGTSLRQFLHYGQGIRQGDFRQYDFGNEENLEKYGKRFPPDYPLGNVTAPVAIYYGANDLLVSEEDSKRLASELKNNVLLHLVDNPYFNHLDFLWANDVRRLVYDHVLKFMSQY